MAKTLTVDVRKAANKFVAKGVVTVGEVAKKFWVRGVELDVVKEKMRGIVREASADPKLRVDFKVRTSRALEPKVEKAPKIVKVRAPKAPKTATVAPVETPAAETEQQ